MIDIDLRLGCFVLQPFQVDNYIFFISRSRRGGAEKSARVLFENLKVVVDEYFKTYIGIRFDC
jgi:hypothetical protein